MNGAEALHDRAMDLLDEVHLARRQGHVDRASELIAEAFRVESEAAELLFNERNLEPSRSIILKSAAVIAVQAAQFRQAEKFAAAALSGDCPAEIAEELRSLIRKCHFHMLVGTSGTPLEHGALRFSIDGPAVGIGWVAAELFRKKLFAAARLLQRTYDRVTQVPFRGNVRNTRREVVPYVGAFAPGSFTVDLMLAEAHSHEEAAQEDGVAKVESAAAIVDVIDCFEALQSRDMPALRALIPDEGYLVNFVALARDVLPDGKEVSELRLAALTPKGERYALITRQRSSVVPPPAVEVRPDSTPQEIEGYLKLANSLAGKHEVAIEDPKTSKTIAYVVIPPELMDDIVRPRWGQFVKIQGTPEDSAKQRRVPKFDFVQFLDVDDSLL